MLSVPRKSHDGIFDASELKTISSHGKLSALGISIHFSWLFSLFAPMIFTPTSLYSAGQAAHVRAAFVLALAISLIILWRTSDFFFDKRIVLLVLSAVLGSSIIWPLVFSTTGSSLVFYIYWVCAGIGYACSLALWSEVLSSINPSGTRSFLSLGICFGAISSYLIILISSSSTNAAAIIFACFPFAESVIMHFLQKNLEVLKTRTLLPGKESDKRMDLNWHSITAVMASGVALGFVVQFLMQQTDSWPLVLPVFTAAATAGSLIVIVDSKHKRLIDEDFIIKIFLPTAAIGLFPVAFASVKINIICGGLMLLGLILQNIMSTSSLSGHARLRKLAPMRIFCFGRLFAVVGFLAGWTISYLAVIYSAGTFFLVGVSIVLVVVFIFLSSFVFENHYPGEADSEQKIDENLDIFFELKMKDEDFHDIWKRKREKLARECNLSPRQEEVLALLAKGRDTKYIQEKLVISNHTAKAHIYAIYQKTDVHSRQELIDLIEKIDVKSK